jgi:hypothetical protein
LPTLQVVLYGGQGLRRGEGNESFACFANERDSNEGQVTRLTRSLKTTGYNCVLRSTSEYLGVPGVSRSARSTLEFPGALSEQVLRVRPLLIREHSGVIHSRRILGERQSEGKVHWISLSTADLSPIPRSDSSTHVAHASSVLTGKTKEKHYAVLEVKHTSDYASRKA